MSLPINLNRPARIWATNVNYLAGSAAGTPTKTDPGPALAAEGCVPGRNGAQSFNHLFYDLGTIQDGLVLEARRNLATRACLLRELSSVNPYSDTASSMAAISGTVPGRILAIKSGTGGVKGFIDGSSSVGSFGTLASITSLVNGVARNGSRLVVIGTGGNLCAFSTDEGLTWTAGSALPAVASAIVYNAVHSRFMAVSNSGVSQDVDGASTWTTVSLVSMSLSGVPGGIAVLSSGRAVVPGLNGAGDLLFSRSSDGGASWSTLGSAGTQNAADYDDSGWIAGNAGSALYHVGRLFGGSTLQITTSADGITWTPLLVHTPASAIPTRPKILMCGDTGALWVIYDQTDVMAVMCSVDNGVTWSAPTYVHDRGIDAFACARGRLIATVHAGSNAMLEASDGVLR